MQIEQRLTDALSAAGVVVRPLDLSWQSRYQLGSALSPVNVSNVLRRADYGDVAPLQDLLSEVRQKHPKLHAALQIREQGVLSLTWTVKPYQKPARGRPKKGQKARGPLRRHVEVARFCEDALKGMAYLPMCDQKAGGYQQALGHLLSGIYRGFSVGEVVTKKDALGRVVPDYFSAIASRRFRFVGRSNLVLDDRGKYGAQGLDLFAKYPGRFVAHRPRVSGEEPHREGLGRLLLFHLCFAIWSMRDWMQYAEAFGKPWIFGKSTADQNDPETVTATKQIIDTIEATHKASLPFGVDVEVKWPIASGGQTTSPSADIIDKVDEYIILGVLGQLASMGAVQNGLGGGGDVRDLVRRDLLESDALYLAEVVTHHLFAPLVAANYGQDEPVPQYVPDITQAPDADKLTKSFATGAGIGMRIPRDWSQAQLGWPVAGEDEAVLGEPAPDATGAPGASATNEKGAPDEGDDECEAA